MSTFNAISPDKLFRLIGTSACPTLIDVRDNPTALVPGSQTRHHDELELWAGKVGGPAVVICKQGKDRAAGAAAWLRHVGVDAEILDGGFEAWVAEGLPVVDSTTLPPRDEEGRTRLGHPRSAEGRPHRLPVADPAVRRPSRRLPFRRLVGSGGGCRAV